MKVQIQKKSSLKKGLNTHVIFTSTITNKGQNKLKIQADKSLSEPIHSAFKCEKFKSGHGETLFFRSSDSNSYLFIGLGEGKKVNTESLRRAMAISFKKLSAEKCDHAVFDLDSLSGLFKNENQMTQAMTEGLLLAEYNFDECKASSKKKGIELSQIYLTHEKGSSKNFEKGVEAGTVISESVNFSRRLGDLPGNLMNPSILAKEVTKAAKNTKLKVIVWDKARIKKEKMGGLYGVSLGSNEDPRFIIMEYKGAAASKSPICLVGKGLTFDSGGISIKPAQAMDEMKYDMCGGANVIGAMFAIANLGLKVNVKAYIPASENMSGGSATKPGDILTMRNGKTVEVLNTDAEGRLILADALCVASEQKPQAIFDMATLTGAMVIALSNIHTGIFSNDDKVVNKVKAASKESGELVWHLPLHSEHTKDITGRHADLQNIGATRGAGSSTAAAFLQEFVSEGIPWVHFDIAGTGWSTSNRLEYNPSRSASGVMIRTLVELAKKF